MHYSLITILSLEDMNGDISDYVDPSDFEQTLFLFGIDEMNFAPPACFGSNDSFASTPEHRHRAAACRNQ